MTTVSPKDIQFMEKIPFQVYLHTYTYTYIYIYNYFLVQIVLKIELISGNKMPSKNCSKPGLSTNIEKAPHYNGVSFIFSIL